MKLKTFFENIVKSNTEFINGEEYDELYSSLKNKIDEKDYSIGISLTKIDSIGALNDLLNLNLEHYIEDATMSKDFTVRNKAQKYIQNKIQNKTSVLKDIVAKLIAVKKKPQLKRSKDGGNKILMIYKSTSITDYYIKFSYDGRRLRLISIHNEKYTFKKKSYNDNSSYKFGNREQTKRTREEVNKTFDY